MSELKNISPELKLVVDLLEKQSIERTQVLLHKIEQLQQALEELKPEGDKVVSVTFVAQRLGYSTKHIRNLCTTGHLKATQPGGDGGEWRIPYKEFERLKAEMNANRYENKLIVHRKRNAA